MGPQVTLLVLMILSYFDLTSLEVIDVNSEPRISLTNRGLSSNFNVRSICARRNNTAKAYAIVSINVTWFRAYIFCNEYNMKLLTINSREETEDLKKELETEKLPIQHYWTAATRHGALGVSPFVWFTDGVPVIYTNWFHSHKNDTNSQPDNATGNEMCVCISAYYDEEEEKRKTTPVYTWHDSDCESEKPFICESDCNINGLSY